MKKGLPGLLLFFVLLIAALYFFIPATKTVVFEQSVSCTADGALRQILDSSKWVNWWPGKRTGSNMYLFQDHRYRIDKVVLDGFEATVFSGADSTKTKLQIQSSATDTAQFVWTTAFVFSTNPFKRIRQSAQSNAMLNNISRLAKALTAFFQSEKNIYGMMVVQQRVKDSSLVALKRTFTQYPSVPQVYGMIDSIKTYIRRNRGEETGYPMLNVYREAPALYDVMVAIPTKGDLASEGKFLLKKMVLGYILEAQVQGGVYKVLQGEQELTNYVSDRKKESPAIPFQSLVTNRMLDPDTTKWITRLYYPVFY